MYRVSYYISGSKVIAHQEFDNLALAVNFSVNQPINSVLEIKLI